jgi:hypothetical protein
LGVEEFFKGNTVAVFVTDLDHSGGFWLHMDFVNVEV